MCQHLMWAVELHDHPLSASTVGEVVGEALSAESVLVFKAREDRFVEEFHLEEELIPPGFSRLI